MNLSRYTTRTLPAFVRGRTLHAAPVPHAGPPPFQPEIAPAELGKKALA